MPMLMLKCKTCGEVFPGIYLAEDNKEDLVSKLTKSDIHICVRGDMRINIHPKIIWIGLRLNKLAKLNWNILLKQSYRVATRMILPLAFYISKKPFSN